MWSKQRRKKEGKDSGNIPPPGKTLPEDRLHPPSHPTSPQSHPAHPHKAQPPSQPLPTQPHNPPTATANPPPSHPQPPQRVLLANPNLKPSLTVPLPSAPLTENILDSLQSSAAHDGSTSSSSGGDPLAGTALPQQVPPGSNSGTAPNPSTAQQLQKVIDAQRAQLAVTLTQLTQQLAAERAVTKQPPARDKSPVSVGGVVLRKQTFDYANVSNKELEKAAAQQLEREYCEDTW